MTQQRYRLVIRASPTQSGRFEVFEITGSRRTLVPAHLVEALAGDVEREASALEALEKAGYFGDRPGETTLAWLDDGWAVPAYYLHASQNGKFDDADGDFRASQEAALGRYTEGGGIPVADRFDGDRAYDVRPAAAGAMTIGDALMARRSAPFGTGRIAAGDLFRLLADAFEYPRAHRHPEQSTDFREYFRSFGSAFDVLIAVMDVEDVASGFYWYSLTDDSLVRASAGSREEVRTAMETVTDHQGVATGAGAAVLLVARFDRYQWRYRHERALRQLFVDAGRLGQNLGLAATAQGLSTWYCSQFDTAPLDDLIGAGSGDSMLVYAVLIGPCAPATQPPASSRPA